jgi:hypothetical protein
MMGAMSRERMFEYRIGPRTPELGDLWETMCDGDHDLMPRRVCNGGGSNPEGISVWMHANATKARRIAARLDLYFGRSGDLVPESVILAELAEDQPFG